MNRPAVVKTLTVTLYGVKYSGTYFVQDSVVYVQSAFGSRATHLGSSTAEETAKLLLSELVRARTPAASS